jgi:hypothetical protein
MTDQVTVVNIGAKAIARALGPWYCPWLIVPHPIMHAVVAALGRAGYTIRKKDDFNG